MTPAPVSECLAIDLQPSGMIHLPQGRAGQAVANTSGRMKQLGMPTHFSMKFPPRFTPSVLSWSSLLLACVNEPRMAAAGVCWR